MPLGVLRTVRFDIRLRVRRRILARVPLWAGGGQGLPFAGVISGCATMVRSTSERASVTAPLSQIAIRTVAASGAGQPVVIAPSNGTRRLRVHPMSVREGPPRPTDVAGTAAQKGHFASPGLWIAGKRAPQKDIFETPGGTGVGAGLPCVRHS